MTYQQIYTQALKNGCSPKFADMLASRQSPGLSYDNRAFMHGRDNCQDLDGMSTAMAKNVTRNAVKAGVDVRGKMYVPGLAEFPSDPNAWVRDADEIKAKCEAKGLNCEGAVNYKASEKSRLKRAKRIRKNNERS